MINYSEEMKKRNPVEVTFEKSFHAGVLKGLTIPQNLRFVDRWHAENWINGVINKGNRDFVYNNFQIVE
jgi:hypothetical protein